jgi:hypothetical protein
MWQFPSVADKEIPSRRSIPLAARRSLSKLVNDGAWTMVKRSALLIQWIMIDQPVVATAINAIAPDG